LAFGTQEAPAVSDGLRYGQDSVSKQWKKVQFKPLFQLRPSSALGKQGKAFANFPNANDAQV
jgi:hypothetical protein